MRFPTSFPRVAALLLLVGVAACSAQTDTQLNGVPTVNTARVALAGGAAEVALNICSGQLERRPNDPDLLVCKGDALAALGRGAEAGGYYERAMARDKTSADARIGLGRLRLGTDPAAAEALFLEALSRSPRNPAALNDLGIARDLQGRHADAQTAYGEAIAAAPNLRAPQVNLALSMALSGRAGEAVRILRPIGERSDATARERHDLAAALTIDNKPDDAARLLRPELEGRAVDDAMNGFRALPAR